MILALWTGYIYVALIALLALLVVALLIGYELLRRDFRRMVHSRDNEASGLEKALLLQDQLENLSREVRSSQQGQQKELQKLWRKTDESLTERLDRANDLVSQVRQTLGGINDASQRIYNLGSQLTGLSEALRMPPSGAGGGALWLADLLGQILPADHFQTDARLGDGDPIDAVVRMGNFLIGVDAGLEMVAGDGGEPPDPADVREHVDQVAARCIHPEHGTVDFALMYLPVEAHYYDLIIRDGGRGSLAEYALTRRVIPVSPNTLYAYLYTIVLGLRGLQIEQDARRILRRLEGMQGQFDEFEESFRILGTHLERATSKYDQVQREVKRFGAEMGEALAGDPPPAELPEGEQNIFSAMASAEDAAEDAGEGGEEDAAPSEEDESPESEPGRQSAEAGDSSPSSRRRGKRRSRRRK